ncbi:MAG: InlB B-repeat-containing protein [Pseudomonadota bacterium]
MFKRGIAFFLCGFFILFNLPSVADPYPPTWGIGVGGAIHYSPVSWPSEPVNPVNCGTSCGDWKPYTRFQQNMNDPRTQDPSNGGTSPQAYVNVTSSCSDKTLPSIYYYLHQGATPVADVLMFRWRVESAPHNYATGPSAGNYGSSNPWSSALWTVLFDIDGSGYRSLAAHLDGSTGSPSAAIDRLVGIWSNTTSQSLDYINDANVHALGHNPTAFIGPTGKVMNFHSGLTPNETWANGAAETVWNYGTTRAVTVTQNSCTEYFIDYQIPIALLDASGINGPKITRTSPISMLFCTANSLNNPFQKDCAINKSWTADSTKPAPYGDYISFNQTEPYSQPIISSVTATAPNSCPGSYTLKATVQDTLALQSGVVVPSVQSVDFFYWRDDDGDGLADEVGGAWSKITPTSSLDAGTLNKWTASWDASALAKGKYLIGAQALDDNTRLDTGMTATGINNRTFSYLPGDAANKIYIGAAWQTGQQVLFPTQSPTQTPSSSENWYGNPDVTGQQIALVGTAINACGVAPTIALSADTANVAAAGTVGYTITLTNPVTNSSSITISAVTETLPAGFTYQPSTTLGTGGLASTDPGIAGQVLTWTYGSPVSLAPGASATLIFDVTATSTAGNYNATAASTTSFGVIQSSPVAVAVDAARLSFTITPSAYSIAADGSTQLTFTLNYANDSTVSVTGASITGSLPSGATYVTCTGGTGCSNTLGSLSWPLGTLAGGATGSATLVLTVPSSWTTSSLTQAATLAATAPDASPVTKAATSTVAVTGYSAISAAAFTLTKSANATQIAPGGAVTYTIAYANYGGTSASSVVITDSLPAGMTYVSATGGGVNASNTVTWTIGAVAAGASGSVTVTATAASPFTAYTNPSSNSAAINWSGGSTVTSSSVAVGVTGQACSTYYFKATTANVGNAGTQKVANISPVPQVSDTGSKATATLTSAGYTEMLRFYQDPQTQNDLPFSGNLTTNMYIDRNNGQGMSIRASVYDYNSTSGAVTSLAQNITSFGGSQKGLLTFTVPLSGTLLKNHRLLWVYEATANNNPVPVEFQYGGTVTNGYTATPGTTFANSNAQYCITPPASLNTQVSVNQVSILAAATPTLTYTISYSNTGTASATNSSLVATLPSGFTGCQYSLNNSTWSTCSGAGLHTFNSDLGTSGTVAGGSSGIVYVRGTVPAGTTGGETFTDTVSLSSDQTSAVLATAITLVAIPGGGGAASLTQSLSASTTTAAPGDTVTYSLTLTNVGGSSATNVIASNILPVQSYFTYGGCSDSCTGAPTLAWPVITLAAGASRTYTYTMIVGPSGLPSGVTLVNSTATAAADGGLTAISNTVIVTLNGNPELSAVMSATPNTGLVPDDTIVYSITLQNIGNASASNVVVSDPIPASTSYSGSITASAGSGSFDAVNNRVLFDVGSMAAGASVTLSYEVTVNGLPSGPTTITNTASASASNAPQISFSRTAAASATPVLDLTQIASGAGAYPAATLTANASSTTIYVNSTAAFQVNQYVQVGSTVGRILSLGAQSLTLDTSVTASSGASVIGAVTLSLAYRNTGNATATSTSLTDTLPSGLGFYTSSPLATSAPSIGASGAVTWTLGSLAVDAGGTVSIIAFPTGVTGNLTSLGVLSASNATSATGNATIAIGGLSISKSTSTPVIVASGTATYTITLTNSLSSPATSVSVTDTLAEGFSYKTSSATVGGTPTEPTFAGSDTGQQQPQWSGLTVPATGSLVISFEANAASTAGAGTYQNDVAVTAAAGVGILQFDALSNTAEDVTLLAANRGVVQGHVFYRNAGSGSSFIPGSDLPLADVRVEIYKTAADCADVYSANCHVVFTDSNGYFQKVVAAENWYLRVATNTGDLSSSWDQVVGDNPTQVSVPDQSSVTDQNGFKLVTGYMVTASANTGGSISPISHTVTSGNTTAFTVTPDTGYSIDPVTGTCGGNLSGATFTTNAITANCTVIANFSLTTYAVTFDLAGGSRTGGGVLSQSVAYGTGASAPLFTAPVGKTFTGWSTTFSSITGPLTVTALYTDTTYNVTPSAGSGGSISPATVQSVVHGNTTSFTLTPDTGYSIASVGGTCGGNLSGASYTTNAVTAACTVVASFSLTNYTVTFDLDGGTRSGGGVLSQSVAHGSGATAPSITPPTGKMFASWSTSFTAITGPLTVTAIYVDATYSVTPSAGTGGSISPSSAQTVIHGNTTSFTISADTGYSISAIGGTCGGNLVGSSYTTNIITANCTVVASFTPTSYTVTFDLDGGTRTGGGILSQSVAYNTAATAPTLTPPVGKVFDSWSTSFSAITGPLTVTAIYSDANYSVTPSAGTGGSISPATVQTVTHGNTTGFTVNADTGYSITSVTGSCGGNLIGASYTTDAIMADCTLVASFTAINYPVTFDLAGGTRIGGGSLNQSVTYGSSATAPTLTPPTGKTFTGWSSDFSLITGPLTVTAIYGDVTHSVTPSAGVGGTISPASVQTIVDGSTTSFTLSANTGYSIASVAGTCGGNLSVASYTTNAVTADCTVTASFTLLDYPVIFDLAGGTRTGGGILSQTVSYGADATAPALTPPAGKTFTGWSSSFVAITGPLTVVAIYDDLMHSVTPTAGTGGSISPATVQTLVDGSTTSFTITANTGYSIAAVGGSCGGNLSGATYITNAITADCTVSASFTALDYAVTFDLDGGTRTGGGALSQTVANGGDATAPVFTVPVGKTFTGWSSSFTSITGPLTVVALYTNATFSVTPSAGSGGSISPATVQTVADGGTTSFTVTPNTGYSIAAVGGTCGGNLSGNTYLTDIVTANCLVTATFTSSTYTVTFELAGGSRTGGGALSQSVAHGAAAIAPGLTPPAGKVFTAWSTSFSSITGSLTVTALYADTTYSVTATVSSGGTVTPIALQTVAFNASVSYQVLPEAGYTLTGVTGICSGIRVNDTYTTSAVTADCVLDFIFHKTLKSVDEEGDAFAGEVLGRTSGRTFLVEGGSGNLMIAASVKQAGITTTMTTGTASDFFSAFGASLVDNGNGSYRFTANRSGLYSVTFTDTDGQSLTMTFTVYPTIGFTSTYQESATGKTTQVRVLLDDDPIDYPVEAPFAVDGNVLASDLPAQGVFTIASGRVASIQFVPNSSSGDIDFVLPATGLQNAVLGSIVQHTVSLKDLASVPLNLSVSAQQAGETKQLMLNADGTATLVTSLTGTGYSYDWSGSAPELGIGSATSAQPTFNPQTLKGVYLVKVTVTELAAPNRSITVELLLRIVADAPASYTNFYNLEYQISPNRLPICTDGGMDRVNACHDVLSAIYMETLSTYEIKLGRSSDYASWRDLEFALSTEVNDIRDEKGQTALNQKDTQYLHLGYEVDFEISGLEQSGQTVPVVIPLKPGMTIPANAVWRKYSESGWHNFVEDEVNLLFSAKRDASSACPSPSDTGWTSGLKMGDDCVRLIIQDGGPNDFDARADGVVRDPSVLAVKAEVIEVTTVGKGKSRGGVIDVLFLLLLMCVCFTFSAQKIVLIKNKSSPKLPLSQDNNNE